MGNYLGNNNQPVPLFPRVGNSGGLKKMGGGGLKSGKLPKNTKNQPSEKNPHFGKTSPVSETRQSMRPWGRYAHRVHHASHRVRSFHHSLENFQ